MLSIRSVGLVCAVIVFSTPALADPALLSITATGSVDAEPDSVTINTGVESNAKTAKDALNQNSAVMANVVAAVKSLGIPENEMKTSNLSVSPRYASQQGYGSYDDDRPITGYRATNQITVTLNNARLAGAVFDALVAAGANRTGGLSFFIRNDEALLSKARAEAVRKAINSAKAYAAAAGVALGPIHAITDNDLGPMPPIAGLPAFAVPHAPTPVGIGEQTVNATVTISWELKQ